LEEQIRQSMRGGIGTREDFDRVVAEAAKSDVVTVATAFAEGRSKDLRAHLGKINTPVTIIAATMTGLPTDQLMARWHTQVAAIRDVDLVFIAARHFVMLDQPDAFYALLDKAIASAT
jgi:pimeloyl-ACP methyl ester carboxylesterase